MTAIWAACLLVMGASLGYYAGRRTSSRTAFRAKRTGRVALCHHAVSLIGVIAVMRIRRVVRKRLQSGSLSPKRVRL
jgi:divalent metal cation (Fe/Co/Zn/Cd) transporter